MRASDAPLPPAAPSPRADPAPAPGPFASAPSPAVRQALRHYDDEALVRAALDEGLGTRRALAIDELARRALARPALLEPLCEAISSDRRFGPQHMPLGWIAADRLYASGDREAMARLLRAMDDWQAEERDGLLCHWVGKDRLGAALREFQSRFGWAPPSGGDGAHDGRK